MIVSSNPADSMNVSFFRDVCVVRYRSLRLDNHSSRGVLSIVVCLTVIVKPR
jgi:hypothetical protein